MGAMYVANFVFVPRANRSTNDLPQARNILFAMVWLRLHSVLRIWPLRDRWSANTFRCPGRWRGTSVIPLFSDHRHMSVAKSLHLVPPWFLRQPLTCCRTWVQPLHSPLSGWKLLGQAIWLGAPGHWCVAGIGPGTKCQMQLIPASGHPNPEYCCLCTGSAPHLWSLLGLKVYWNQSTGSNGVSIAIEWDECEFDHRALVSLERLGVQVLGATGQQVVTAVP